jgi:crotonobetainyl-CoA:carnitine CoA-transferase CaiB-like acyl-CoA transferase
MVELGPLSGVRVVEHCGWSGTFAGRLLADGGADVVRLVPSSGDPLSFEPPFLPGSGESIQYLVYNAGKRVVQIDLARAEGREEFERLVSQSDILLEDWGDDPPVDGLRFAELAPGLVRVSVRPFGLEGPWSKLRTNDLAANALSGAASVTGNAETPPLNGYGNQTHHTVGMYAAVCALAALRARRLTGAGQHVDLSEHEALVSCTEQVLMQWFFPSGFSWPTQVAQRQGSLHWTRAYEVYPGITGRGIMVTTALRLFDVLLPWMEEEGAAQDLVDREKYPDPVSLIKNLPHLMQVVREWVATRDADELFFEAQRRHQPFGVVWDVATALQSPQIEEREFFKGYKSPGGAPVALPGRFFRTDADVDHPAPPITVQSSEIAWSTRSESQAPKDGEGIRRPLEGVRILDFTHVLAGPFGTRVLGDLGAEVIKVGTASRGAGANSQDHPYYVSWNRNKKSITLNMKSLEGRALARQLAGKSDMIIENFSAGVLSRWGMDRPGLQDQHPHVSVISMGGMGQTGPWSDFVTFAPTIHALTGLTHLTNPPGRYDLGYGFSLTDHLSGLAGALAVCEALEHQRRTGQGLAIDLSQYELGLGIMAPAFVDLIANGRNPEPVGNRHPFDAWAPHGIYPCEGDDRWVAIAARGDDEWATLAELMGKPALATDARFVTHDARVAHYDELDAEIAHWTATLDRYEVMRLCQDRGLIGAAVQDAADLATSDPQLRASEFFGTASSSRWPEYGFDRFPARFNGVRPSVYDGVHDVGQDTFDVLSSILDLDGEEIASLVASGALT